MAKKTLRRLIDADLFSKAEEVLGNSAAVEKWFYSHSRVFGGKTPLEFYQTRKSENIQEIYDVLGRIEYGVYS
jgi:hypothetical protein